jgi:hypothetical protein
MPGAGVCEYFLRALFIAFGPCEFGGQNGEGGGNYEESWAWQDDHGDASEQHKYADNSDDHFFDSRFQLTAKMPQKLFSAK